MLQLVIPPPPPAPPTPHLIKEAIYLDSCYTECFGCMSQHESYFSRAPNSVMKHVVSHHNSDNTDWSLLAHPCDHWMGAHHCWICTGNNQSKCVRIECKLKSQQESYSYEFICSVLSSAFGSLRYPWWMVILVTPFMLSAEAVYTIVDKHKLLMGFLGAIVSSDL